MPKKIKIKQLFFYFRSSCRAFSNAVLFHIRSFVDRFCSASNRSLDLVKWLLGLPAKISQLSA